ncbi:MAG TPA: bifunctional 3-(3-hydroxy-phenyl)propionate/3-hydroxycinnamic acid hydroxylase [Xanthobacteraceae bacterium]
MVTREEYDVVISGYGPTGLAAASLIARQGHRVCVFERWPSLYGQPRMATIDGESARIIQAASDISTAMRNSVPRTRYLFANSSGEILIDSRWDKQHICGFPFRISLHQPDIEDAMDRAARERGAEINQGWEVLSIVQNDQFVTVTARERDGSAGGSRERAVRAKYVIGADGAHSTIRDESGVARERWPFRNAWLSFDTRRRRKLPNILGVSPDAQVAVVFCLPEGRAHSIIPLGTGHIRFNLEVDPDRDHGDKLNDEYAYRFLKEVYGLTSADVEVYRHAVYPFEGRLAERWRVGRVFLAGDAAHLMTPFLGQGGCSALRDAINLAWKLDLVLRGIADDRLLDTYEVERKPHVRVHIEGSDKLAAMAFVRKPSAAAERDRLCLAGKTPPMPPEPILTDGVLLSGASRSTPVGDLAPQGIVRRGGCSDRFDDLVGWGFQLIGWRHDPAMNLHQGQREFLARIGGVVCGVAERASEGIVADVNGAYGAFFRRHEIETMLARPDFTIFGVARSPEESRRMVEDLRDQLVAR